MAVTIKPSYNAPLVNGVKCDLLPCTVPAVADAYMIKGAYAGKHAYMCLFHLEMFGTRNPQMITNITLTDLEIPWIRS